MAPRIAKGASGAIMPLKFTVGVLGRRDGLGTAIGSGFVGSGRDGCGFGPATLPAALSALYFFATAS